MEVKRSGHLNIAVFGFQLLAFSFLLAGCGDEFLDPTQVGRFRPVPAVNVILDSLGVAEESPSVWQGTEGPRPVDVVAYETDYVFSSGDVVRISIFELLQENILFVNDYVVTETGKISIPEVGIVEVMGLTESQLEDEIKQIISPSILKEPSITVALMSSQQRSFSIFGDAVPKPNRYTIPRYDFRLTDAIATAGGIRQFNVSYIYISRLVTGKEVINETAESEPAEPEAAEQLIEPELEMLEIIAPRAGRRWSLSSRELVIASTELATDDELAGVALPEDFESVADDEQMAEDIETALDESAEPTDIEMADELATDEDGSRIEWVFQDGKWVPVQIGQPELPIESGMEKAVGTLREKVPEDFDWEQVGTGGVQMRVIEIPVDKLLGGDPRYNVVVRPSDSIHIPVDIIGEFCIMGNVNGQGFINLTGRPMTLKMAIAAAGGLGPLAWPKNCEVTRRIGKKKEETVMVDLDKIAKGEQPDFFIKPNDLINVGTHPTARWRAVLRNAFRATYGFGFIYDRNFADRDYGTRRPIPDWF